MTLRPCRDPLPASARHPVDMAAMRRWTRRDFDRTDVTDGMTSLLWAAHRGQLDVLRLAVEQGASVHKCDHEGNTALHHAAANGHVTCVVFLVVLRANLWALDNNGKTPRDIAAHRGQHALARYLDTAAANQTAASAKAVKRLKTAALLDAKKRAEKYDQCNASTEFGDGREVGGDDGDGDTITRGRSRANSLYGGVAYSSYSLSSQLSGRSLEARLHRTALQMAPESSLPRSEPNGLNTKKKREVGSSEARLNTADNIYFAEPTRIEIAEYICPAEILDDNFSEYAEPIKIRRSKVYEAAENFNVNLSELSIGNPSKQIREGTVLAAEQPSSLSGRSLRQGVAKKLDLKQRSLSSAATRLTSSDLSCPGDDSTATGTRRYFQNMFRQKGKTVRYSLDAVEEEHGKNRPQQQPDLWHREEIARAGIDTAARELFIASKMSAGDYEENEYNLVVETGLDTNNSAVLVKSNGALPRAYGTTNFKGFQKQNQSPVQHSNGNGQPRSKTEKHIELVKVDLKTLESADLHLNELLEFLISEDDIKYTSTEKQNLDCPIKSIANISMEDEKYILEISEQGDDQVDLIEFLQSNRLSEYTHLFEREQIDMTTIGLLTNRDLAELGLPMGPRRKLIAALESRNTPYSSIVEPPDP